MKNQKNSTSMMSALPGKRLLHVVFSLNPRFVFFIVRIHGLSCSLLPPGTRCHVVVVVLVVAVVVGDAFLRNSESKKQFLQEGHEPLLGTVNEDYNSQKDVDPWVAHRK